MSGGNQWKNWLWIFTSASSLFIAVAVSIIEKPTRFSKTEEGCFPQCMYS